MLFIRLTTAEKHVPIAIGILDFIPPTKSETKSGQLDYQFGSSGSTDFRKSGHQPHFNGTAIIGYAAILSIPRILNPITFAPFAATLRALPIKRWPRRVPPLPLAAPRERA